MSRKFNSHDYPICFSRPLRIAPHYWARHIPFAMFLVDILRPKVFVELGTYYGVSYCAFCQAVKELNLETRCYGVDTWQGDGITWSYDVNEVLEDLKKHHDPLYGRFSRLTRSTFDVARENFHDGEIDLLHIDGYHPYDSVKYDFETWLPKMSQRGVIVFHDINVRQEGYGVWKLWSEIKNSYPHFEMWHEHGLGVLAVGQKVPKAFKELLVGQDEQSILEIRNFFFEMGNTWIPLFDAIETERNLKKLQSKNDDCQLENNNLRGELEQCQLENNNLRGELEQCHQLQPQTTQESKTIRLANKINFLVDKIAPQGSLRRRLISKIK